ncbi:MAG: glycosyltransferase family 2 protein [Pseudomonadota bacterium]
MGDMMKNIKIIIPVYNEGENLRVLYKKLKDVTFELDYYSFKILFVDDGSIDNSTSIISELIKIDPTVSGLVLSRNFGKELALTAGIESATDVDAVICIDSDLQHPPEYIPDFISKWEGGSDIVAGIRKTNDGSSFVKKTGSKLFYYLMKKLSDLDMPVNGTDYRLIDKSVLKVLCKFSERTRMFRGLTDWVGFKKAYVEFDSPARNGSSPTYSIKKLFGLAINSITSFSLLPLKISGYFGLFVMATSLLLLIYMAVTDFFNIQVFTAQGYFIVFNTLLVGITLSSLGMIALYIGHIHTEVVGRPLYIIKEHITSGSE